MWLPTESPTRLALSVHVPARRQEPTAHGGGTAPVLPSHHPEQTGEVGTAEPALCSCCHTAAARWSWRAQTLQLLGDSPAVSPWAPDSPQPTQIHGQPSTADTDCATSVTNTTRANPVSDRLTGAPAMASSPHTANKTHLASSFPKAIGNKGTKATGSAQKSFRRWNFLFKVGACELGSSVFPQGPWL